MAVMTLRAGDPITAVRPGHGPRPGGYPRPIRVGIFSGYDVDFGHGQLLRGLARGTLTAITGGPWFARGRKR